MISRGAQGGCGAPFVKIIDHFGGPSPLKILALPLLSKFIDLAYKGFSIAMISYAIAAWLLRHL